MVSYACAAGVLCGMPDKPIPLVSVGPRAGKPQHACIICGQGMHGVGFGCGHLFDDVSGDLNRDDESVKTAKKADKAGAKNCNRCHSLLVCEAITKTAV